MVKQIRTDGPCWYCGGAKVCHQYVYTFVCPQCGGSGLQSDAAKTERRERERERLFWRKVAAERRRHGLPQDE